jgi:membrane-associated phospholipid phosphatase
MATAPRPSPAPHGRIAPAPHRAAPWAWASAAGGCAALLIALVCAGWQPLLSLDARAAGVLHTWALSHPEWTGLARVCTDWVWDTVTMRVLVAVVVVMLWRRGERALGLLLAATVLAGVLVQQGLKAVIGRERPQWKEPVDAAHFAAMPSGHAMTAALACALLTWLAWSRLARASARWAVAAAAATSMAGVSLTRVYLGVHWVSDVVAGVALGVAMAALAAGSWHLLQKGGKIAA